MAIRIITDSTSDVTQKMAKEKDMIVVPLHNLFGNEEFLDGVTITNEEFYQRLAMSEQLPTTSQPSPEEFLTYFLKCKEAKESVIVLTIASKLSGTYQSALIAKEVCEYEDIHIIDSLTATMGLNILVEYAVNLRNQGKSVTEIVSELEECKNRIRVFAVVDTLKYLKKGGRLSTTAAIAGTLLNVKPIVKVLDGVVGVAAKSRGLNGANKKVMELIQEEGGMDQEMPYCIGYTADSSVVDPMKTLLEENLQATSPLISPMGSTIGVHAGPGACGVAFFANK